MGHGVYSPALPPSEGAAHWAGLEAPTELAKKPRRWAVRSAQILGGDMGLAARPGGGGSLGFRPGHCLGSKKVKAPPLGQALLGPRGAAADERHLEVQPQGGTRLGPPLCGRGWAWPELAGIFPLPVAAGTIQLGEQDQDSPYGQLPPRPPPLLPTTICLPAPGEGAGRSPRLTPTTPSAWEEEGVPGLPALQ